MILCYFSGIWNKQSICVTSNKQTFVGSILSYKFSTRVTRSWIIFIVSGSFALYMRMWLILACCWRATWKETPVYLPYRLWFYRRQRWLSSRGFRSLSYLLLNIVSAGSFECTGNLPEIKHVCVLVYIYLLEISLILRKYSIITAKQGR